MSRPAPDAIVIGSGFGGAVAAARLAEGGMQVLVLERGPWWPPAYDFAEPGRLARYPRGPRILRGVRVDRSGAARARAVTLSARGLFEAHVFDRLAVFTANGVGGGSHTYTAVQARPDTAWLQQHFPEDTLDGLDEAFDRVAEAFPALPLGPGEPEPPFAAAARRVRGDLARPPLAAGERRTGRTQVLGADPGGKLTLDRSHISRVLEHGGEVRALHEAVAIDRSTEGYSVIARDLRTGRSVSFSAPRLVLAAGTLATVRLLLTARDRHRTLPALPAALGRGFRCNADVCTVLLGTRDGRDHGRHHPFGAWMPGRTVADEPYVVGEVGLPSAQLGLARSRALSRVSLLVGMGADGPGNSLSLAPHGGLRADVDACRDADLYRELSGAVARLAAGYRPRRAMVVSDGTPARPLLTVHPLGGAAMASRPEDGVVSPLGEIWGHPGLYVTDGAALPAAPGLPPSMTIAALAERTAVAMLTGAHEELVTRA